LIDVPSFSPEEWTALATSLQAVIVAAAAVAAVFQVREARKLREDQARPFILVDFDINNPPLIHITIANTGPTMARSVRIEIDPPLESSLDEKGRPDPMAELPVFTNEIPSMAPGKVIRLLFDSFIDRESVREKGSDLRDAYRVTVRYRGERGLLRQRSYKDTMLLDLGIYRNIQYVDRRTIHDLYGQIKKIADAVGHWGAGAGTTGVVVVPRKEWRKQLLKQRRRVFRRHASQTQPSGTLIQRVVREFRFWRRTRV
jgi:hypothetical protein